MFVIQHNKMSIFWCCCYSYSRSSRLYFNSLSAKPWSNIPVATRTLRESTPVAMSILILLEQASATGPDISLPSLPMTQHQLFGICPCSIFSHISSESASMTAAYDGIHVPRYQMTPDVSKSQPSPCIEQWISSVLKGTSGIRQKPQEMQ